MLAMAEVPIDILRGLAAQVGVTLPADQAHQDNLVHLRLENWARCYRGRAAQLGYSQVQPETPPDPDDEPPEPVGVAADGEVMERALLVVLERRPILYRVAKTSYVHRRPDYDAAKRFWPRRPDEDRYRALRGELYRLLWHVLGG